MTLKFTPDGKVDRCRYGSVSINGDMHDLADALDECVAALRECSNKRTPGPAWNIAKNALRKIGAEPK